MSQRATSLRVLVAVTALAVAAPATARDRLHRARPRIVNGTYTSAHPTVGALLYGSGPGTAGMQCSGTLIGCETFLTAAHCVCASNGVGCQSGPNAPDPSRFFVYLQHGGIRGVSHVAVRPDYDFPVGDVAVLTLAAPVTGIAPTPINATAATAPGMPGTIVGFGRQGAGVYDYGLKRAGQVALAPCTDGVSDLTSVCWSFETPVGAPGTDSNTCNGDSGGPLFVDFGCGAVVAGITSGGVSDECTPSDASYDANVHQYRAWIQAQAGADLDNRACGAMPQVGEAGSTVDGVVGTLTSLASQGLHQVTVPPGTAALRIALNAIDDGASDFDLYVKRASAPTTSDADCAAEGPNQYGVCSFTDPTPGTWHVLVNRFAGAGTYQLTTTVIATGAPGPGTGGQSCDDGNSCTGSDACTNGQCAGAAMANGTPCDDARPCTGPDACDAGVCAGAAAPLVGCHAAGSASLTVKNNVVDDARDTLTWRWSRGATAAGELGDPVTTTPYELCLFDESAGVPSLVLDATIPAGPAWRRSGIAYAYRDRTGTVAGITSVRLRPGAGSAAIALKAKGTRLPLPPLPFAQDGAVTVQLLNGGACWEGRYTTSRRNQLDQFRARSE